jgi:hypothetical protein
LAGHYFCGRRILGLLTNRFRNTSKWLHSLSRF